VQQSRLTRCGFSRMALLICANFAVLSFLVVHEIIFTSSNQQPVPASHVQQREVPEYSTASVIVAKDNAGVETTTETVGGKVASFPPPTAAASSSLQPNEPALAAVQMSATSPASPVVTPYPHRLALPSPPPPPPPSQPSPPPPRPPSPFPPPPPLSPTLSPAISPVHRGSEPVGSSLSDKESSARVDCRRYGEPVDSWIGTKEVLRSKKRFSKHFFNYLLDGHNCLARHLCIQFGSKTPSWGRERELANAHAPVVTLSIFGDKNASYDPRWLWHVHEPSAEISVVFEAHGSGLDEPQPPTDATWEDFGVVVSRLDATDNYGHSMFHVLLPLYEAFWERGLHSALDDRKAVLVPLDGGTRTVDAPAKRCLRRRLCGKYCRCDKDFVPSQVPGQLFKYIADPFAQKARKPICFRRALLAPSTKHILDMKQFTTSSMTKKKMFRSFSDLLVRKLCPSCFTGGQLETRSANQTYPPCPGGQEAIIVFFTRCPPGLDHCTGVSSGNGNRAINNEGEVRKLLSRYGHVVAVNPGTISLEEQIRLTRSAHLVVGAIGSAMTNLLWMLPGRAYVELSGFQENAWEEKKGPNLGPYNVHTTFLELAETMQLRVLPYVDRFSNDRPTANNLHNNIAVRLSTLESLIQMGLNCSIPSRMGKQYKKHVPRNEIRRSKSSITGSVALSAPEGIDRYPECFRKEHPQRNTSWAAGCVRMGERMSLGEGVMTRSCESSNYFGHALGARNCHVSHVCASLPPQTTSSPTSRRHSSRTDPVLTMYTDDPHVPRHWRLPCPLHRTEGRNVPFTRVVTAPAAALPCNATWEKIGLFFTPATGRSANSQAHRRWTTAHGRALVEQGLPLFETLWEHGHREALHSRSATLLPLWSSETDFDDAHPTTGESVVQALFGQVIGRHALVNRLQQQALCFEESFFEVAHKHMLGSRQLVEADADKRAMYRAFSRTLLRRFCPSCQARASGSAKKVVLFTTEACDTWSSESAERAYHCVENGSLPFSSLSADSGRAILNKKDLLTELQRYGRNITVVNSQGLTLRARMELVQEADIIVGPTGSWMVDLLWAQPGKAYIELGSFQSNMGKQGGYMRGYVDIFTTWQELALAMELRLFVYADKWSPHRAETNSHTNPIYVDAKEIRSILTQVVDSAGGGVGGVFLQLPLSGL
jgi:hypothetical protein